MDGVWYSYVVECPGVPLDTVIGHMSPAEPRLDHIADRLVDILKEMYSYLSETLGSAASSCPFLGTLRTHSRTPRLLP